MKPCAKNRQRLGWLAINALEPRQTEELRAHLETCPGCRHYFQEMTGLVVKLTATGPMPEIEASEAFHRALARRIEAEGKPGAWAALWAFIRSAGLKWRVVAPVTVGVAAAVFAVLIALAPQRRQLSVARVVEPVAATTKTATDVSPTLGNYRMLVNRSFDALDQELTREEETSPAGAPVYTMSNMARVMTAD